MSVPSQDSPVYRFGIFEVHPRSGDLRRNGVRLKVQEQPYQVLLKLLEHAGEVVTREELRSALWPADTFVDFETGLNTAIKRLRETLGDSAENPRFVETVPRRGYRFIGMPTARATVAPAAVKARLRRVIPMTGGAIVLVMALLFALHEGKWRERLLGRASPRPIESLAVLPLTNLSGDPAQEYFADGMTEEVIAELSKIGALRVISRTSVMHYKGTSKTVPEIERELRVDALVEGSVVRSGDRVRVTAQLIDALADKHLWTERYYRQLKDGLALQAEVARDIASEIKIRITPPERAQLTTAPAVNPEAHDAYLRGRYYWNKRTGEDLKRAIQYYQRAIEIDPIYAPAYLGLADCYRLLPLYGSMRPKEAYPEAKAAVIRALELNGMLAEANAELGQIKFMFEWDWSGPEQHFRRAMELNPNSVEILLAYSEYLILTGRFEEGLAARKRAIELDPLAPMSSLDFDLGWAYFNARRYDEGIAHLRKLLELDPNFQDAHAPLAFNYAGKKMYAEAVAECERAGNPFICGWIYAVSGRRTQALQIVEKYKQISKREYVDAIWIVATYAALGQKDQALEWLEKNYEERALGMVFLKVAPDFDSLRSDPRFQDVLRRMAVSP
jgi:TolB-like protein/DNA-binding winged helix-turn-helix (wHTH) protein